MRTKKFMFKQLLAVVAVLFLANACADYDVIEGQGDYSNLNQLIIGGDIAPSPEYDAVVSLHQTAKGGTSVYIYPFCSGTLITEDVVLTAAHCLNVSKKPSGVKTIDPTGLVIRVGVDPYQDYLDGHFFDGVFSVSETKIHEGYDPINLVNDIALLRVKPLMTEEGPVLPAVDPIPALPSGMGFTDSDIGAPIDFAGFGQDGVGNDAEFGVRLHVVHELGSLGCDVAGCPTPGDTATQIAYTNVIGPCFGDSGGPAFIDRNGKPYVGGITSYGDADCAVYGVSTRVDAFEDWIGAFVSGTTPDPDPTPGCGDGFCDSAGGETCDNCPDDCLIVHPKKGVIACCGNGVCEQREDAASCSVDCLP